MNDENDSKQPDPSPPEPEATPPTPSSPADSPRRAFLARLATLGLAQIAISFMGSTPHAGARPAQDDTTADCGATAPGTGGGVYFDSNCATPIPEGFQSDKDCGRSAGGGFPHTDGACGRQATPEGMPHADQHCGKQYPNGSRGDDLSCALPLPESGGGGAFSDDDCALVVPGGHMGDSACGKPSYNWESTHADDRCAINTPERAYIDFGCSSMMPDGAVQQDDDCGLIVPPYGTQSDSDCGKQNSDGDLHKDSDCKVPHPPFQPYADNFPQG